MKTQDEVTNLTKKIVEATIKALGTEEKKIDYDTLLSIISKVKKIILPSEDNVSYQDQLIFVRKSLQIVLVMHAEYMQLNSSEINRIIDEEVVITGAGRIIPIPSVAQSESVISEKKEISSQIPQELITCPHEQQIKPLQSWTENLVEYIKITGDINKLTECFDRAATLHKRSTIQLTSVKLLVQEQQRHLDTIDDNIAHTEQELLKLKGEQHTQKMNIKQKSKELDKIKNEHKNLEKISEYLYQIKHSYAIEDNTGLLFQDLKYSNQDWYVYCKLFSDSLYKVLDCYSYAVVGMFKIDPSFNKVPTATGKASKILKYLKTSLKIGGHGLSIVKEAGKTIPVAGTVLAIADTVIGIVQEEIENRKLSVIKKDAMQISEIFKKCTNVKASEMEDQVARIALQMTDYRKTGQSWHSKNYDKIKIRAEAIYKSNEANENKGDMIQSQPPNPQDKTVLAIDDVYIWLSYLLTQDIEDGALDKQFTHIIEHAQEITQDHQGVFILSDMVYYNPMANAPELLQQIYNEHGASAVSEVLDLGKEFSNDISDMELLFGIINSDNAYEQVVALMGWDQVELTE